MYGPVRTVVWQGSAGDRCPYARRRRYWIRQNTQREISRIAAIGRSARGEEDSLATLVRSQHQFDKTINTPREVVKCFVL